MQGPESGQPIVLMQFTTEGARKFEEITRRLVERGRVVHDRIGGDDLNAFQQFAIVLDRELKSAPSVSYIDNPNGIPGVNGAEISGIGHKLGAPLRKSLLSSAARATAGP